MSEWNRGKWTGGIADWFDGDVANISVAFTWQLDEAYTRAIWFRTMGYHVRIGGPGVFTRKKYLEDVAEIGGDIPDAIVHQNPMATIASRGCPVGCWFCIVPKMEGKDFTELPDFPVRPVLCDNNLSALSPEYQEHIISRYENTGVPLLDANSGFEPRTFNEDVFRRWKRINRGPWRFAYDDQGDGPHVEKVMKMLAGEPSSKKRVYVLIGNEPFDQCIDRINRVISWGGEPHAQPFIKLNALKREPHVRHDWTRQRLTDVARYCNRYIWRKTPFDEYDGSIKTKFTDSYNEQEGMFV